MPSKAIFHRALSEEHRFMEIWRNLSTLYRNNGASPPFCQASEKSGISSKDGPARSNNEGCITQKTFLSKFLRL